MDNEVLKSKTLLVIIVTLITMVAEIGFGIYTHSMALTADGFHMGTHALALFITFLVCSVISRYKNKEDVLNALGGYTSALFLGLTSLGILYESIERFIHPQTISFNEAILVTVIGLLVNALCILIMSDKHAHPHAHACHIPEHKHEHLHKSKKENLNFKAAYLHILADALTSIMAIIALTCGKYFGWVFLDPLIGIVGGWIIFKWSIGLIKSSFNILISSPVKKQT